MKSLIVQNPTELATLKNTVIESMQLSSDNLEKLAKESPPLDLFSSMKFSKLGFDPLDPERPLNLIEQINQSFTYLASFLAVEILFVEHPDLAPFKLNLGTAAGADIESQCKKLSAEVFASVTPTNNQKLKNDINKVLLTDSIFKYSFFMCPGFKADRQANYEREGVKVWALEICTTQ